MEQKLKEFRQKKRRERIWDAITLKSFMDSWISTPISTGDTPPQAPVSSSTATTPLIARKTEDLTPIYPSDDTPLQRTLSNDSLLSVASSNASVDWPSTEWSRLTIITYALYTLLWLTCWLIAIQLRFGAVYLVLSGLVGIYLNTRTGPRRAGEMSAYSVFNPNCEAIDGTLKAEQFEKEFNLIHH